MPELDAEAIVEQARQISVETVVTAEAPVGPLADGLKRLEQELNQAGLVLHRVRNDWDARAWPHATRGFFPFKQNIPKLLQQAGLV